MRRSREDAEQTRRELLDASMRVFAKRGYVAAKLADIAREAGVTRGAIYHHFGSKKELFTALFNEKLNPYYELFDQIILSDRSPVNKIRAVLSQLLKKAHNDITFAASQKFGFFSDIESIDDPAIRAFIRKRGEYFFNNLVSIIEEGKERGEMKQTIDPVITAINLIAFTKGLVSLLIMDQEIRIVTENTDKLVEQVIQGL